MSKIYFSRPPPPRQKTILAFRRNGFSTDLLFDFSIATDIKNSSFRTIYFDQALLGMSREYIVKGMDDEDVKHYYDFMQEVRRFAGPSLSSSMYLVVFALLGGVH